MKPETQTKVIPGRDEPSGDQLNPPEYNIISEDWNIRHKYTAFFSYIQRKGEKRDTGDPKSIREIIDQHFSNLFSDGSK